MPDNTKPRSRSWDESQKGVDYRRKYNEEHYARLNCYITPALKARLDDYSKASGISKNQIVSEAIIQYLDANETGTD